MHELTVATVKMVTGNIFVKLISVKNINNLIALALRLTSHKKLKARVSYPNCL